MTTCVETSETCDVFDPVHAALKAIDDSNSVVHVAPAAGSKNNHEYAKGSEKEARRALGAFLVDVVASAEVRLPLAVDNGNIADSVACKPAAPKWQRGAGFYCTGKRPHSAQMTGFKRTQLRKQDTALTRLDNTNCQQTPYATSCQQTYLADNYQRNLGRLRSETCTMVRSSSCPDGVASSKTDVGRTRRLESSSQANLGGRGRFGKLHRPTSATSMRFRITGISSSQEPEGEPAIHIESKLSTRAVGTCASRPSWVPPSWEPLKEKDIGSAGSKLASTLSRDTPVRVLEKSCPAQSSQTSIHDASGSPSPSEAVFSKKVRPSTANLAIRTRESETKELDMKKLHLQDVVESPSRAEQNFRLVLPAHDEKDVTVKASGVEPECRSQYPRKDQDLGFPPDWVDEMHDLLQHRLDHLTHKRLSCDALPRAPSVSVPPVSPVSEKGSSLQPEMAKVGSAPRSVQAS
eukprot:CAMPEP_0169318524 /NCGR_PEP_ID=MMETSP1017-20121227/7333_1 /TAXON_ID=342587 /ORGANISM="Karlodinium micrum, Strain CCMP2283" /LENGTH=462 /DNA_ID=CAMNT_0009412807 /DNA_START=28 /DNA_END=1412 /DNA_ORIENTATION=-